MSQDSFSIGQVLAPLPGFRSLLVMFRSSQIPTQPVRMLHNGPCDPTSITQAEMPRAGTWGLVCFPSSDNRNGIWLGSINGDWRDAMMSGELEGVDCGTATDPNTAFARYHAGWTGAWEFSGYDAATEEHKLAMQWTDNSSFILGLDQEIPTMYRQTVDDEQNRVQEEYTMEDRVEEPPEHALELKYTHGADTTIDLNELGDLTILGGTGTNLFGDALERPSKFLLVFAGTTFSIDEGGNTLLQGADAATLTIQYAGAEILIDTTGNITIQSPGTITIDGGDVAVTGATNVAVASSGPITIAGLPTSIDAREFLLHTHIGVTSGIDISGPVL